MESENVLRQAFQALGELLLKHICRVKCMADLGSGVSLMGSVRSTVLIQHTETWLPRNKIITEVVGYVVRNMITLKVGSVG